MKVKAVLLHPINLPQPEELEKKKRERKKKGGREKKEEASGSQSLKGRCPAWLWNSFEQMVRQDLRWAAFSLPSLQF